MALAEPRTVAEVVGDHREEGRIVVADRAGEPWSAAVTHDRPVVVLVGPEGGFTAEELAAVDAAGGRRVSLGPNVLRIETAAIALAARLA